MRVMLLCLEYGHHKEKEFIKYILLIFFLMTYCMLTHHRLQGSVHRPDGEGQLQNQPLNP